MAITGISSYDGKQIIAAGAQSAISAGIASNLEYKDGHGTLITTYPGDGQLYSGGFIVGSTVGDKGISISPNLIGFYNSTGEVTQINSGKVTAWDSLSSNKQDKLTFGYTDDQISQINGSAIYSQGGGGGVVTATGGTTTYVQTINNKNISATNAGSAVSATNAYNLTNTAIKVASATSASTAYTLGNTAIKVASAGSASTAYTLGNTAIKVASATSATNANTATYASNGVSLTNIYNSARSGYAASAYIAGKEIFNGRYQSYDSYNNPNWWTGNNIFGLKLNSASVFNSTGINIEGARVDGIEIGKSGSLNWMLYVNFIFDKFIPINTGTWRVVASNFFSTTAGHFVAPIYSTVRTNWDSNPFGAVMIDSNTLWTTDIKLTKFEPYTGYTANKVFVNFTIPWVGV